MKTLYMARRQICPQQTVVFGPFSNRKAALVCARDSLYPEDAKVVATISDAHDIARTGDMTKNCQAIDRRAIPARFGRDPRSTNEFFRESMFNK